jgi:membrane-associated phospholipid phosphatase
MSNLAPQGGFGGFGGFGGGDNPALSGGLISSRDGIVGSWHPPGSVPDPRGIEDAEHLALWDGSVRAHLIDFEMFSRIGFAPGAAGSEKASVWHLEPTSASTSSAPAATGKPLADITRPPSDTFAKQLVFVDRYADLRADRMMEILVQIDVARAFFFSIPYLRPDRTKWTLELLDAAYRLAIFVEMRLKHALACRRPMEYSPQIQPMLLTPSHGALPSGHATESFAAAYVLSALLRYSGTKPYEDASWGTQLMRLASRMSINRTVAGVHFPVDSAAGAVLGLTLGQYFVARCRDAGQYGAWGFDGTKFPAAGVPPLDGDFYWDSLYDVANAVQTEAGPQAARYAIARGGQTIAAGQAPFLTWLWTKAVAEWT